MCILLEAGEKYMWIYLISNLLMSLSLSRTLSNLANPNNPIRDAREQPGEREPGGANDGIYEWSVTYFDICMHTYVCIQLCHNLSRSIPASFKKN